MNGKLKIVLLTIGKIRLSGVSKGLSREEKIRGVGTILILGFFFAVAKCLYGGMDFPQGAFLPTPICSFGDFYGVFNQWTQSKFMGVGFGLTYFPGTYLFVDLLRLLSGQEPHRALFIYLTLTCLYMALYAFKNLRMRGNLESAQNVAMCFMSYPVLFTYDTGNWEFLLFIALSLFVYFYPQRHRPVLTSFLLAAPISMKLFPAVFLVLFLADRRYKEIVYTFCWIFALSILPLLIFDGGIRGGFGEYLGRLRASQGMYKELMIISNAGLNFGHSLLGLIRIILYDKMPPMASLLMFWLTFTMVLFGGMAAYVVRCEKVLWKQVTLLVIAMDLLPFTSTDYKLLHFFIPLFLFVNAEKWEKFDFLFMVLFALLLVPKDYIYFHNNPFLNLNVVSNPVIMIVLGFLIIVPGLKESGIVRRLN